MQIIKYGHSALHVAMDHVGFIIDPGSLSDLPKAFPESHAILITHEHGDHLNIDAIKKIIRQFPEIHIITNSSIVDILVEENIVAQKIIDGERLTVQGVEVCGVGSEHAEICCEYGLVENRGFMIGDRFFYPGDSFVMPPSNVDVLAAPIAAPWMAIKECIGYINDVNPEHVIPVHDAILSDAGRDIFYRVCSQNIKKGVHFHDLENHSTIEL